MIVASFAWAQYQRVTEGRTAFRAVSNTAVALQAMPTRCKNQQSKGYTWTESGPKNVPRLNWSDVGPSTNTRNDMFAPVLHVIHRHSLSCLEGLENLTGLERSTLKKVIVWIAQCQRVECRFCSALLLSGEEDWLQVRHLYVVPKGPNKFAHDVW